MNMPFEMFLFDTTEFFRIQTILQRIFVTFNFVAVKYFKINSQQRASRNLSMALISFEIVSTSFDVFHTGL